MKGENGTNSDGLMVVFRLAGSNALVQKILFCNSSTVPAFIIVWTPPPPFYRREEVNFDYLPQRRGI